jgi:GTPase SAR1 family protein
MHEPRLLRERRALAPVREVRCAGAVLVLIGNRADLGDRRQVQWDEAQDFAQRYGMKYFEISAKTGVSGPISCCVALIEDPDAGSGPPAAAGRNGAARGAARGCC